MKEIQYITTEELETYTSLEYFILKADTSYSIPALEKIISSIKNTSLNTFSSHMESSSSLYNPLFLQGTTSTGKTHFLEGIIKKIKEEIPDFNILFLSCADLIAILNDKATNKRDFPFLDDLNALFIDDIHLLLEFPQLQIQLAHYIDILIRKSIFISATYSTSFIASQKNSSYFELESVLFSRLSSGLVWNLPKPDLDMRMRYTQQQCEKLNMNINKAMQLALARSSTDLRQIQGFIKTIALHMKSSKNSFGEEELTHFLANFENTVNINPDIIIQYTAHYFNLQEKDLKGKSRLAQIVFARQISMYICRKLLGFSYPRIAEIYGGRDHTTIIYACSKVEESEEMQNIVNILSHKIQQDSPLIKIM